MSDAALQQFNLALGVVNFIIATVLIMRNLYISRDIGAAAFTATAQSAYQDLLDDRDRLESEDRADRYYNRLWAAQALQFEQWRRRLIPDLIYCDWLTKRREQYINDAEVGGISFRDAWQNEYSVRYRGTAFGSFMTDVFKDAVSKNETVQESFQIVKKTLKSYWRHPFMRF